jgi:hypothetical protein
VREQCIARDQARMRDDSLGVAQNRRADSFAAADSKAEAEAEATER